MGKLLLEEVFKVSGVPTLTFVKPSEYNRLLVSLRTIGRGVIIEGPSGIGKTTAVSRALSELGQDSHALRLSARRSGDISLIEALPDLKESGTVIVDDFHRLDDALKRRVADFMKVLADDERADTKLILVGINRAGESLVKFATDLLTRLDIIPFEANSNELVRKIAELGESALNIRINTKDEIVDAANGSFFIAQLLCRDTCLHADVMEKQDCEKAIATSFEVVRERVINQLAPKFMQSAIDFAKGPKLRRAGRAPYLHILKWLADSDDWSIQIDREMNIHPDHRAGVGQVIDKGYLTSFLNSNRSFGELLHYEPSTKIFTAQDPQFVFFLRNLHWNKFADRVGYASIRFPTEYDFAISFAGNDRNVAEAIFNGLAEDEISVFYDKNEQHRILAQDVEEYLGPIYRSEAAFVICLLGPEYPKRIWAKFESGQFKERFGKNSVIPVWFANAPPGMFDESARFGGVTFDPFGDVLSQVSEICELLKRKLEESRYASERSGSDSLFVDEESNDD